MSDAAGPRRRPRLFRGTVLLAVLALAGGAVLAAVGYARTAGPDGVVRGYLEALARGDAGAALAFGDVPAGPHTLLTGTVLAEQHRLAPMRGVHVDRVQRTGDHARVAVRYRLDFPGHDTPVETTVPVHRTDGDWRLDAVGVATQIQVVQAADRATVLGAAVPDGTVLLFPGAVPVRFDTPDLQLDPGQDTVEPDTGPTTQVFADVSAAGTRTATTAFAAALRVCLTPGAGPRCPQPTERYVPGSIRGTVVGDPAAAVSVQVGDGDTGELEIAGTVTVDASYRRLAFDDTVQTGHGRLRLPVRARMPAAGAGALVWMRSS